MVTLIAAHTQRFSDENSTRQVVFSVDGGSDLHLPVAHEQLRAAKAQNPGCIVHKPQTNRRETDPGAKALALVLLMSLEATTLSSKLFSTARLCMFSTS